MQRAELETLAKGMCEKACGGGAWARVQQSLAAGFSEDHDKWMDMARQAAGATQEKLLRFLESEGYTDLRVLDDGKIVGVMRMLFTWRTIVDMDETGHGGGVDWKTYEEAAHFARTMQTIDEMPPPGFTSLKRRTDYQPE